MSDIQHVECCEMAYFPERVQTLNKIDAGDYKQKVLLTSIGPCIVSHKNLACNHKKM